MVAEELLLYREKFTVWYKMINDTLSVSSYRILIKMKKIYIERI